MIITNCRSLNQTMLMTLQTESITNDVHKKLYVPFPSQNESVRVIIRYITNSKSRGLVLEKLVE